VSVKMVFTTEDCLKGLSKKSFYYGQGTSFGILDSNKVLTRLSYQGFLEGC